MDKQKAVRGEKECAFVDLLNQEMKELQDGIKQIEDMAKDIDVIYSTDFNGDYESGIRDIAKALIKMNYRKIPEGGVVLTREENEKWLDWLELNMAKARKETVDKIADWLDNEKGYCGLGYLVKQEFCTEGKYDT